MFDHELDPAVYPTLTVTCTSFPYGRIETNTLVSKHVRGTLTTITCSAAAIAGFAFGASLQSQVQWA